MENLYLRRPYSLCQEEIAFHRRNPETGIILGAEPFELPGQRQDAAILMLHGYTSTPRDLRQFATVLNEQDGYSVKGVLLPGHGTKPLDLDSCTWNDWYSAAEKAFRSLAEKYRTVHIVGFSMGGALALLLAARNPSAVGRIVLLSPFFKIAYNPAQIVPQEWLVYSIGRLLRHLKKRYSGNCSNPQARRTHVSYYHYALSSINQSLMLTEEVLREIKQIQCAVLMIHSTHDKTTSYSMSRKVYSKISSQCKRFITLTKSNHLISQDFDSPEVLLETRKFLTSKDLFKA